MPPKIMDMFKELRDMVATGFEENKINVEVSENLLHLIFDLESEIKSALKGDYVYEQNQLMLLRGIKNELHDLNKNMNKRR